MSGESQILKWMATKGRPVTPAEVTEGTGLNGSSARAYLHKLGLENKIRKEARGLYSLIANSDSKAAQPAIKPRPFGALLDASGVLRRLRRSLQASTDEAFAEALGIPRNVLETWEKENTLSLDVILSVARRERIPLDWLFHGDHPEPGFSGRINEPQDWHGIPVYSAAQAGGMVAYEVDQAAYEELPLLPSAAGARGERVFGIQVRGKSMMPYYLPGDTVVCSADRTARVGQDVVLIRHGLSEATLKRLDHFEPGKAVLRPLNASYRSTLVEISPEDRLYPVIGLWRIPPEPLPWTYELGEKAEAAEKKKKK